MAKSRAWLRRLQEELRSLEARAVEARKRQGKPWSHREAVKEAKRAHGGGKLDARRVGEWLGEAGRAPRDTDQVWALLQVWSAWAEEEPGRQEERTWRHLVDNAQPVPERGSDTTEDNDDLVAQLKALLYQEPSKASWQHWYPLEDGLFPVRADSEAARRFFVSLLHESVIQTFGNEPARFVFVLSVGSRGEEGQSFPVYSL